MTTDQLIALSASVAAFLSTLATFLTVREMAKQREDSSRPDLALSRTLIRGELDSRGASPLVSVWNTDEHIGGVLRLLNVGLGTAKDVNIKWSFAVDESLKRINDLAQRTLTPAYIKNENEMLSLESTSFGARVELWRNQRKDYLDYVLPAAIQEKPVHLRVPGAYIFVVSMLLHLEFLAAGFEKSKGPFNIPEMPELTVDLDWLDIAGRRSQSTVTIRFNLIQHMEKSSIAILEPRKN